MLDVGRLSFASPRGAYVDAVVFATKEQMYNYIFSREYCPGELRAEGLEAMFLGFVRRNASGNPTRHRGTLCFYQGRLDAGLVAHECAHAALNALRERRAHFRLMRGTGTVPDDHPEEYLCWVIGHLVAQFWQRWSGKTGSKEAA